jgi:hypothetical protein
MDKILKTLDFQVLEKADNGGRILISNAAFDRDSDRVFPTGAQLDNYLRNPVVQWGHGYSEPWQTVGKTTSLEITGDGIIAQFELRPAANDQDPQNIVKLLWDGGWIRTASIGFIPRMATQNAAGGKDFTSWELLEWSLVPIPANSEALRLAFDAGKTKARKNTDTWIRRMKVRANGQEQEVFSCFNQYDVDIPSDALDLQWNNSTGDCDEIPHPKAGQTVINKEVRFIPPIEIEDEDAVYGVGTSKDDVSETDLIASCEMWETLSISDVLLSLQVNKAFSKRGGYSYGVNLLTHKGIARAKSYVHRLHANKRGRVISAANESELTQASADIDAANQRIKSVLAQVTPEQNALDNNPEIKTDTLTPDDETVLAAELGAMLKAVKTLF